MQQEFRQRVPRACRKQSTIRRLRHEELLDAAHILADGPMLEYGLQEFHDARLLLPRDPAPRTYAMACLVTHAQVSERAAAVQAAQCDRALRPNGKCVEKRCGMLRRADN